MAGRPSRVDRDAGETSSVSRRDLRRGSAVAPRIAARPVASRIAADGLFLQAEPRRLRTLMPEQGVLALQRTAGNAAVADLLHSNRAARSRDGLVVQRDQDPNIVREPREPRIAHAPYPSVQREGASPTRDENIAALKRELAAATGKDAGSAEWRDVALRLNGFAVDDRPAICSLIPSAQLTDARSAVQQHLAGWPGQGSILAALNAQGRQRVVHWRPSGGDIWHAYQDVGYDKWQGEEQRDNVWEFIGGSIGRTFAGQNTCGARVSYALNHGGSRLGSGVMNAPETDYKGKKGDGLYYIVWTPQLIGYLQVVWGEPEKVLSSKKELDDFEASLKSDEVAVFVNDAGAHTGLIKKGYKDPYVDGELPVLVWRLP